MRQDGCPGNSRVVSVASAQVGGAAVVPAGASAVAYNITVVRPTGPGRAGDAGQCGEHGDVGNQLGDEREVIANGSVVALWRRSDHPGV